MVEKIETAIFQAKAHWCKLLGKPRPSYDGKKNEWVVDLLLDKDALKILKDFGIDRSYVKKGKPNKDKTPNELTGKPVMKLVRNELRADGSKANPVDIRDENGQPWDPTKLIGNGSVVNVKIMKFEVKLPGQPVRMKPYMLAMQVWDHVPYESKGTGGFETKGGGKTKSTDSDEWDTDDEETETTNHYKEVDFDDEIPY